MLGFFCLFVCFVNCTFDMVPDWSELLHLTFFFFFFQQLPYSSCIPQPGPHKFQHRAVRFWCFLPKCSLLSNSSCFFSQHVNDWRRSAVSTHHSPAPSSPQRKELKWTRLYMQQFYPLMMLLTLERRIAVIVEVMGMSSRLLPKCINDILVGAPASSEESCQKRKWFELVLRTE